MARKVRSARPLDADPHVFCGREVYGSHHAVLYGKCGLLLEVPGHGFFFVKETAIDRVLSATRRVRNRRVAVAVAGCI